MLSPTPQEPKDLQSPKTKNNKEDSPSIGQLIQDRIEAKRLLNIMREQGLLTDDLLTDK